MHTIRRAAHRNAWYNKTGDPPTYNPFGRMRSRANTLLHHDEEAGVPQEGRARLNSVSRVHSISEVPSGEKDSQPFQDAADTANANELSSSHAGHIQPMSGPNNGLENIETATTENEQSGAPTADSRPPLRNRFRAKFGKKDDHKDNAAGSEKKPEPHFTFWNQIKGTLFSSWINILLVAVPAGIALNFTNGPPVAIFVVNFVAIIPLAAMLSYATEEIALRVGETLGGLLNATFGNAVELIVSILALRQKQVLIVQTSLIGSMLSNLLLVMGMCFFFGGLNRIEQFFNVTVAQTASSLLSLSVASLIIPTAFNIWANAGPGATLQLSRGTAILLLIIYGCYLIFQLKSHASLYNEPSKKAEKRNSPKPAKKGIAQMGAGIAASMGGENAQDLRMISDVDGDEDGPDEPQLSILTAIITLAVSTAFVAVCAEFMVDSINALTETYNISKVFVGLILLPIVGNAAEHATAVTVACKDKMDLAIGVAVGSSMQIALLVLPFVVVLGWIIDVDTMTLNFDGFQIAVLFVSVLLVTFLISDGKSHWLEGVILQMLYIIIAVAAWFYPSTPGL